MNLKALDRSTFMFYFEETNDLDLVLSKASWDFNNFLLDMKRVEPGVSPS